MGDIVWQKARFACLVCVSVKDKITQFSELANSHHPTIKFTAEVSNTETTFLNTKVYKGERFAQQSRLDSKTHFKATETFKYTYFSSCHPPRVKKAFRLLRTSCSEIAFKTDNVGEISAWHTDSTRNQHTKNISRLLWMMKKTWIKRLAGARGIKGRVERWKEFRRFGDYSEEEKLLRL